MSSTSHSSALARASATTTAETPHQHSCPLPRNPHLIQPSPLRPHVLAADRLAQWYTPFALRFRTSRTAATSLQTYLHCRHTTVASLEPLTRKNYGAGLLRFTQFCDSQHVSEEDRMPASDALLAEFIASWSGKVSKSTVDTWLAGVAFWHTLNGAPYLSNRQVRTVTRAATKTQPSLVQKRSPVTVGHLDCLRAHLDLTDSFDIAVFAVATIAFWCCRRLGELIIPAPHHFNPERHIARNQLPQLHTSASGTTYYTLHLPWSKTTLTNGLVVPVTHLQEPSSPVTALTHHLDSTTSLPPAAPLFSYESVSPDGWSPMTRDWFLDRCNLVWTAHGYPTLTGHCFRIGGATELLLRGTPPDVVALQGTWKSRAFLDYWRKIDEILPNFISHSCSPSNLASVRTTMHTFQSTLPHVT
ncbi:DNA breaking-rejoining enzyme [Irpex rosettiformis]|uniref:DNA breaking-rejoining enzyme n=1 Tax=Irpex rosettiformis TaxID=378272 RepID=A0ACB8TNK7_9APHY|nr:DNA breaking-rejoining enzyme [Irpex rosettiformis]